MPLLQIYKMLMFCKKTLVKVIHRVGIHKKYIQFLGKKQQQQKTIMHFKTSLSMVMIVK